MNSKIKIFITGGTFDKEYNEISGELYFKHTHMYELLNLGRCKANIEIETLMMIDSLHMTDKQRTLIINQCQKEPSKQIVITHGTDTMVQTANELSHHIKDKTIVLTGAMIPFKFGSSDGLFNMGSALSFVQALDSGVYIAMNGRVFNCNNVKKNILKGIFEEIK